MGGLKKRSGGNSKSMSGNSKAWQVGAQFLLYSVKEPNLFPCIWSYPSPFDNLFVYIPCTTWSMFYISVCV